MERHSVVGERTGKVGGELEVRCLLEFGGTANPFAGRKRRRHGTRMECRVPSLAPPVV